jgi:predicted nucleic acid-binding protein
MMVKVYLDNCCYNRPFDDQDQIRIHLETQAKLYIQELIKDQKIGLVCSFVSRYENSANPDTASGNSISLFFNNAINYVGYEKFDEIIQKASEFIKMGIKMKDAAHLACAIKAKCDYLLTTDDKFIKKYTGNEIIVCNPLDFLQDRKGDNDA